MVRLKTRYILFELLFPPSSTEDYNNNAEGDDINDLALAVHRPSPQDINIKVINNEIRRSLQLNFGDFGISKVMSLLHIKYFSNMTSTGIIRCLREDLDIVLAALALFDGVGEHKDVIMVPLKVSGTIKKIEQYAIKRNNQLVRKFNSKSNGTNDLLSQFEKISDDEEEQI